MLKLFSIVNLFIITMLLSIFAIFNTQVISINILSFKIEAPIYVFVFINSFIFFIIGGFYGMGYNLLKSFKILMLNRKIKKISNKERDK